MVIEKVSLAEAKKKTIFSRLTKKFINQQRTSKRDQSVQTGRCSPEHLVVDTQTSIHRRRSSLKTFLTFQSPKLIPIIHRVCRRRSINLKTPKRLSSECLQVALIRKIPPINPMDSSLILTSTTSYDSYKQIFNDETSSREEHFSIGPMRWSTPNRTSTYKTSSPYHNNSNQLRRLCTGDQLSFSDIFDRTD